MKMKVQGTIVASLMKICVIISISISSVLCNKNEKSFATSVAGMEELLSREQELVAVLQQYADDLQLKLDTIKEGISLIQKEHTKSDNTEEYLSNPLNAFSLIRRMHMDWTSWQLFMDQKPGEESIKNMQSLRRDLPTASDLTDAVNAIYRLQTTYDLAPSDIASGLLNGKQYDVQLSSMDTFTIGVHLLGQNQFYHSGFWLYHSIMNYNQSRIYDALDFKIFRIHQAYAEVLLKQNRYESAQNSLTIALETSPNNVVLEKRQLEISILEKTEKGEVYTHKRYHANAYEKGCRGGYNQTSKMVCMYNSTTTDFLKLAPLKMEILSLDPYMVMYHEVISDEEIEHMQTMAKPELRRATVFSEENGPTVNNKRTSQFAWFTDNTTDITKRLNRRIADMSGFDLFGSEMLQAMNYGLGGHYDTHFDFFNVSKTADVIRMQGDRIATVLFYLTNVEQGGATVFPRIERAVFPRKGSAVMWYNIDNQGDCDGNTLHAACPVIVGSKWVVNKWIREKNQIFRRPCHKQYI